MPCSRGCCATQAEHYRGVALSPPTAEVNYRRAKDRALNADMAAYKELRRQGVQPKNVNGSANLARDASTTFEIESGRILPDKRAVKLTESVLKDITP